MICKTINNIKINMKKITIILSVLVIMIGSCGQKTAQGFMMNTLNGELQFLKI